MNYDDIRFNIEKIIKEVAVAQKITLPALRDNLEIVDDLGFTSLSVAALIANLEEVFGIDPFQNEDVMITAVRTIKDLCTVYSSCLETH